jgi:transposase-like protein
MKGFTLWSVASRTSGSSRPARRGPKDLIGEQELLKQLTKALVERAMDAELTHHLGYEKHDTSGRAASATSHPEAHRGTCPPVAVDATRLSSRRSSDSDY